MIIGQDFKFRDDIKSETTPVEIIGSAWNGVIVSFTSVQIREVDNAEARIKFAYKLHETKNYTEDQLRGNLPFEGYIGLILNALILEVADAEETIVDGDGNDHSRESIVESGVSS